MPYPVRNLDPHLTHGCVGPHEYAPPPQAAYSLVQPFWQDSWLWPTQRQTDLATPSVAIGRIYAVHGAWPNKTLHVAVNQNSYCTVLEVAIVWLKHVSDAWQHFVFFLTWLVAYLIPDVPAYIKMLMQRELHLAKEARYNESFSTLQDERRKTRTFADLAADTAAVRQDADTPPDEAQTIAWDWDDAAQWKFDINWWPVFPLPDVVKFFYCYFCIPFFLLKFHICFFS